MPPDHRRPWAPGRGELYDIVLRLRAADGTILDEATTYAGLRAVAIDGRRNLINGKPVFQRLVLDQGYYPDGILTAPSEQALVRDIELSMDAGFNGVRLHQKVFEERFLYHCDRLGYLAWGEFGDWFSNLQTDGEPLRSHHAAAYDSTYITQWLEVLERDVSHPAIIGWCPLNETRQGRRDAITRLDDCTRGLFLATKAMDPARPVLDTSGYTHRLNESDVCDSHDAPQDPARFAEHHAGLAHGAPYVNSRASIASVPYAGQPYFVSEFGGTRWNPHAAPDKDGWGYGQTPETIEEFYARFENLCAVLLDNKDMFGYCYVQLTDVFQEQNGIYTFDRQPKFDLARIRRAQSRPAAYERPTTDA